MEEMVALEDLTTKMNLLTKTFFKTIHKLKTIIKEDFLITTKKIKEVRIRVIQAEVFSMLASSKIEDFLIPRTDKMINKIMIEIISVEETMIIRVVISKGFLAIVVIKILGLESIVQEIFLEEAKISN